MKPLIVHKYAFKTILILLAFILNCINVQAQYKSEDELKKAANDYFVEQDYIKALPLFSQLLSLYPKDPNYNYKYGTSYFYAKREKDDALKFLKFATAKPSVDPKAYYYLGLIYHHNYQFSAAEVNYKKFKEKGNSKDVAQLNVDRNIEMCKNGLRLLKSMTDIGVLYKKEIKATEFFRSYDLEGIGGKIIVKPDEFKTKLDLKKKESTLIHLGNQPKMVIFSSYGNDEKTGKDIYRVVKLPNGEWSKPASIGEGINTKYDEDYPFLHPDGRTLYFSSKGYNSMGGYDIFKSVLNPETGQWSFPENLDFPINTPDDDILFISDINNELAFFASSRASKQGELTVYKVQVDAQPTENSIVKGIFIAESNPNLKGATISVMDAEKERTYGVYKTDDKNGDYLLVFPSNGGKYKILVETTDNSPIHSAVIELPVIDGFRALKQELRLVGEGEDEKLVVKNLFDESDEFDITDPLIVENLLKIKAKMDVNITEEELLAKVSNNNELASSYSDVSDEEMVSRAISKSDKIIAQAKKSRNQANYSYSLADEKRIQAKELHAQAKELKEEAENETDEAAKNQKLLTATSIKNKAARYVNETVAALNLAKALEAEAVERESDIEKITSLKEEVSTAINAGNRPEAEEKYTEIEEIAESSYQNQSILNTEKELAENKFTEKEIAYNKARNNTNELANREIEINQEIDGLENKLATTKKKSEKENLTSQIDMLKIDLEDVKYDLGVAKTHEEKLKTEFVAIKNNTSTMEEVITQISNNENTGIIQVDKLKIANDVAYFKKQGLVGIYPEEENEEIAFSDIESETVNNKDEYDLKQYADDYAIISEEGIIKDYNTEYSSALVDAENEPDEREKSLQLAKINQEWVNAIDEEIEISKKQAETSEDLNEKVRLKSKIEKLNNLKSEKQKQANVQLLIAETLTDTANNTEVTEESNVNVLDEEGNFTDYDKEYSEELALIENEEDKNEVTSKKIALYNKWSDAIEQEVLLKKVELDNADDESKPLIENRINELEAKLENNKELISQLEVANITTASNNIENEETKAVNPENYSRTVVAENGEVLDYSSAYEEELATAENKEEVTQNWIDAIDEEIKYRKEQALLTNDEDEKAVFNTRINELEEEKVEKALLLNENTLAVNKEEKLTTEDTTKEVLIAADTENTKSNEKANYESREVTTESLEDVQPKSIINNTANPTVYKSSEKDEKLNVKYNEEYVYSSNQSNKELGDVNQLKDEAIDLYAQSEEKTASLSNISDISERETVLAEANKLKEQAQWKEEDIAKAYAKSNKSEFYNNQAILSKVKSGTDNNSNNATIAEMLVDESNTYFEKALNERSKAESASSFTAKEALLQKAYNLELQALAKQTNAIELYGDNQDLTAVYAAARNSSVSNNNVENNNTVEDESVALNNNLTEENITLTSTSNNNESVNLNNSTTPIYQPLAISLPSIEEKKKGDRLIKEADVLDKEAKILLDSSTVVAKKKEKEELINQSNILTEQAQNKREEAEGYYAKAKEMESEEVELVDELNENRTNLSNEQVTNEDQEVIASLTKDELETIVNTPDYNDYSTAKQTARRLIKEAEVDYIQADKYQQEAEDEKTLGISLKALAAGAQGDSKTKLQGQLKKLEAMIAENESKAEKHRKSATEKEQSALRQTKEAEVILVRNNSSANKFKVIEKVSVYNENLLANVNSNARTTEVNQSGEIVAEVSTENESNEEVVNETEELPVNETEDVLAEVSTENESNEEVVNETEELPVNETEEVLAENTSVNSSNVNIDEIPKVLTTPIFVFNGNNKSEYSSNKPIPGVEKLPEGLVFKVQIGAFRNPIPQDHFKGFAPIMVEDASNGIKRYTAGFFKSINMAVEAKNAIKTIGYDDAFVVAFFNGKRISINEARGKLENTENNMASTNTQTTVKDSNPLANETANTSQESANTSNKLPEIETSYEEVNDGVSTDVHKIEGVFFTIQVGVYSKPVTANQLSNVTPLNSEKTANGLIRYTSGVYKNLNDANSAKERVRTLGISDAFVIAYANGNRVKVSEALSYLNVSESNNSSENSLNSEPSNNEQRKVENNEHEPTSFEDKNSSNSLENNLNNGAIEETKIEETEKKPINQVEVGKKLKLEFKVLLGEYEDDIPVEEAAIYLKYSGKGMVINDEGGKSIYMIGAYPDYSSALDKQLEMKEEGVVNPKVIAFKDGIKIGVEEALELVKNNN